jgi:hypothetical protein
VGHGLQVSFGKMVTLMGVEVIEETVNPNWSEGNQFSSSKISPAGVQLAYKFTDKVDAVPRPQRLGRRQGQQQRALLWAALGSHQRQKHCWPWWLAMVVLNKATTRLTGAKAWNS